MTRRNNTAPCLRIAVAAIAAAAILQGVAAVLTLTAEACANAGAQDCGGCSCAEGPHYNPPTLSMAMRDPGRHRAATRRLSVALLGLLLWDGAVVADTFRAGPRCPRALVAAVGVVSPVVMLGSLFSDPRGDAHLHLAVAWVALRIVGGAAVLYLSGTAIGWASAGALPLAVLALRCAWAVALAAAGTVCASAAFSGKQDGALQTGTVVSAMAFVASFCVDIARGGGGAGDHAGVASGYSSDDDR